MLKLKKVIATVISIGMGLSSIPITSLSAFAEETKIYTYDDYSIEYKVTNSWGNTDAVDVEITNTGDETIENWMLYFDPNGEIAHIWNAKEATSPSGYTYFKNSGYNSAISAGAQVKFSYFVEDCTDFPNDFIMCQKRAEKETGYSVSVTERESWGNRFNGTITLSNDSDEAIEDWELTFDTNFTITEITSSWAGTMTTLEPYSYKLKGSYTNVIAPHTSMALGFSGVKNGTPEIISSTLTEVVVNEELFSIHNVLQNDCIDWSELPDSDGDGLPDEYESNYDCNANIADTDGDGLPDGYEIMKIGSDPSDSHSLDTIITDGAYDNDSDGVSNLDEYSLGTNPLVVDSDYDDLTDGQEVNDYHTDPLDDDTDDDGISDGDEISLGLNPLLTDTDNDGVPDNKETFEQSVSFDGAESDDLVEQISVSFNGTGYINSTTKIESIMDTDWMCSNIVGLIGEPYDITTSSEFENATITFNVDTSSVTESDFDDLIVLWYDEENQRFVNMDAMLDYDTHSLSFTTSHFSKYMIVNKRQWYNAWSENNYPNNGNTLHTAITIDCSGSTQITDPSCYRVTAANSFVDVMKEADLASVIFFGTSAFVEQGLTNDKDALHDAINRIPELATTNYEAAIQQAMNSLSDGQSNSSEDIIIFLSDGAPTEDIDGKGTPISPERFDYSIIDDAANAGIKIYTIGLSTPPGSNGETILQEIADRTNGEYYYAATADELVAHFLTINMSKNYDITTDSDDDGLPDLFETYGMPIANGQVIFTNANDSDTDDDGLADGEEIIMHVVDNKEEIRNAYKYMYDYIPDVFISDNGGIYFEVVTDPTNEDTDGDGIIDGNEVVNVTTDSRYDNLNPLRKDTLEDLFTEYHQDTEVNNENNAVYIQINQNSITINVRVKYTNAYNELASSYITWDDEESKNILESLGEYCKLKDLFEDGIKRRWEGQYFGTKYDFYPGLIVNVEVNFISYDEKTMKDCMYITSNITNTIGEVSATSGGYDTKVNKIITMKSLGDLASIYEGICAHEFGHTLLLADAYPARNYGFSAAYSTNPLDELHSIISNDTYGRYGAGEIMYYNGDVLANDIEMMLIGYSTNEIQFFVPSSTRNVSPAIRQSNLYYNESDHKLYEWNGTEMILHTESGE